MVADWQQERFLVEVFMHYQNGIEMIPVAEWDQWIADGIAVLTHYYQADEEAKQNDLSN
jgi:hypothetical protein